ncbi:MAG: hypothetical protein DRI86_04410 [Bacteroidetes bacterium]|nr:MAG: hypothetical protein DRI86_04410 [Bacteroidota bacterium]
MKDWLLLPKTHNYATVLFYDIIMESSHKQSFSKPLLSIWILGVLSVVFYFLSLLISNFQTGDFGNNYLQIKLQNHIEEVENNMDFIVHNYLPNIDSSIIDNKQYYFSKDLMDYANANNIHVFVVDSESETIAWTDNNFEIKAPINNGETFFYENPIGSFIVKDVVSKKYTIRCVYRLFSSYAVSNEYLKSGLNPNLDISKQLELINDKSKENALVNLSGDYLVSVIWKSNILISLKTIGGIFIVYILSFLFLISFASQLISIFIKNNIYSLLGKIFSILIIVFLYLNILLPDLLYESPIFSSFSFASSFFDNLGVLFFYLLGALFIVFSIDYFFRSEEFSIKKKWEVVLYFGSIIVFVLLLHFIKAIVSDLIFNSTISFNFSSIYNISYLAIIGILSIGVSIAIFLTVFVNTHKLLLSIKLSQHLIGILLFSIIEYFIVLYRGDNDYSILLFFVLLSIVNIIIVNIRTSVGGNTVITVFLLMFSILIAFWFNTLNVENERIKRKAIIQTLAVNQDPQAEFLFTQISKKIYADEKLIAMFANQNIEFDSLTNYIENKYFENKEHFKKYDFQTTVCTKDLQLLISPQNIEINCDTFFYKNLISFGKLTDNKNLYRLDYGSGQINYLGVFRFYNNTENLNQVFTVYMEINSKLKRKGFTRVLRAKEYDPFVKISKYSLAKYENDIMVEKYGNYTFPEHIPKDFISDKDLSFTTVKNYNHLVYKLNDDVVFVLSLQEQPMLGQLAPFSYLFILLGILFTVLLSFNSINTFRRLNVKWNFGKRLQIIMVVIILSSFAIISVITLLYINDLDSSKNRNQLTDLSLALQIEFEHKLSGESDLTKVDPDYLQSLLYKFGKVFDTDINIYQLDGKLLMSTRYEIFDRNLMSELMNPKALKDLKHDHQSIYIDRENIGSLKFSSAYMAFHNSNDEIIAFINLPYFAREEVLKSEISTLLMALMNVYVLIVVIAILIILFVSKYISQPLHMLKEKFQMVSIGNENSKIKWTGIEEIETLVVEYNRMIDALALSSERLAKSERETAWREMAKQVAHEIKNPLTPMKLSVQYMIHSYDENRSDNKERLQALSNTLIEQIDNLTDIATAFSDFADMPKSTMEINNLESIINTAVDIYKDYSDVIINVNFDEDVNLYIDKNQWIRVFNNLIKNSIQAAIANRELIIDINVIVAENNVVITFADNGHGIESDMRHKIFVPNFTTKTKGSGLGLAMVRNIVSNSNGEIDFVSEPEKGTVFTIKISNG